MFRKFFTKEDISLHQQVLEKVLDQYQRYFDIQRDITQGGRHWLATAEFHSRGEKYVLVKKAQLWAMECNEYVFITAEEQLDQYELQQIWQQMIDLEQELVKPHKEHMVTYVTLVILAEQVTDEVRKALSKLKLSKNYKLSIHGWCNGRIVIYQGDEILTNGAGKEIQKQFEKVLCSN